MRVANGDYVWFVDIDDSIGDGILKYLHSSELSSTPDIFQFHAASKDQSNNIVIEPYWEKPIGPMSGIDYLEFEAMNALFKQNQSIMVQMVSPRISVMQ